MKLQIYEDNSSQFHWTLNADDGRSLATSTDTFASYDTALTDVEAVHGETSVAIEAG